MKALASTVAVIGVMGVAASLPTQAQEALGSGVTMYFQMGGNPGDGSTLPRTNGARAAAAAFGVKLNEQYSGWQPETMLKQFREALAASPSCIEIMGHPGNDAFATLVADAQKRGILITSGNSPLTKLKDQYGGSGFGYAGVDLYEGGKLTAQKMIEYGGLKKGDKALEYGLRAQAERGKSDQKTNEIAGLLLSNVSEENETAKHPEDSDGSRADAALVSILTRRTESSCSCKQLALGHLVGVGTNQFARLQGIMNAVKAKLWGDLVS